MRLNAARPVRWINAVTNGFPMHAATAFLDAYDFPYLPARIQEPLRHRIRPFMYFSNPLWLCISFQQLRFLRF